MSNTVILYAPYYTIKEVEVEYEEEVDIGFIFPRIQKQKKTKKDYETVKNSNGVKMIKMKVLLPNGTYQIYTNTTETNPKQVMIQVLNTYQTKGYKAPQIEIVKFLNQKIKELIMVK